MVKEKERGIVIIGYIPQNHFATNVLYTLLDLFASIYQSLLRIYSIYLTPSRYFEEKVLKYLIKS